MSNAPAFIADHQNHILEGYKGSKQLPARIDKTLTVSVVKA
jgi:hypothetical protein